MTNLETTLIALAFIFVGVVCWYIGYLQGQKQLKNDK